MKPNPAIVTGLYSTPSAKYHQAVTVAALVNPPNAGFATDQELSIVSTSPGSRSSTILKEMIRQLYAQPTYFPEIDRKHIIESLPASLLSLPSVQGCSPEQVKLINDYLEKHSFKRVVIRVSKRSGHSRRLILEVGAGGIKQMPYLFTKHDLSPAGQMLIYIGEQKKLSTSIYDQKMCILVQMEWALWQSRK